MRLWAATAVAGLAIPAVFATGVLGDSPHRSAAIDGGSLTIGRAGLFEHATRGSFCTQSPSPDGGTTGRCADSGYPLPTHGRLPVRPGARVVVRPSVVASELEARLLRVQGSSFPPPTRRLHVQRLSSRKWAVELPERLGGGNVLDVSLRWNNAHDGRGDADFWGAIRSGCR